MSSEFQILKFYVACLIVTIFFLYKLYVEKYFLYLYLFSSICTYSYENFEQTHPRNFELCVCVQLWKIICLPHMKSSISALQMLHCVLLHNVTCYTNLLSHIYVNTTKISSITCTLLANNVMLQRLECSCIPSCKLKEQDIYRLALVKFLKPQLSQTCRLGRPLYISAHLSKLVKWSLHFQHESLMEGNFRLDPLGNSNNNFDQSMCWGLTCPRGIHSSALAHIDEQSHFTKVRT